MSIRELIRRPLETLPATASCLQAAALMRDQGVGAVVVTEGDQLLGIVTDRDLVLRVMADGRDPGAVYLHDVMSLKPVYLPSDCGVEAALSTMRELGVRRIPTVDDNGRPDGMISLDDLLSNLGRQLGALSETVNVAVASAPRNVSPPMRVQFTRGG